MSVAKAGWVYFLESIGVVPARIKIGWTDRPPSRRLVEVEHASGTEMRLLGFIWGEPANGDTEWDLHRRFARWRLRRQHSVGPSGDYLGEYFSTEIKTDVMRVIAAGKRAP